MKIRIYRDYREYRQGKPGRPAVAIGNFDGVHRGHQRVLERLRHEAGRRNGDAIALTFRPHPAKLLGESGPPSINTDEQFIDLLEERSVDCVIMQRFDLAFSSLSAEEFFERVLVKGLQAGSVLVGQDFAFGRRRSGKVTTLIALGRQYGVSVIVIPLLSLEGEEVSSTLIRSLVRAGEVEKAAKFLGRPYQLRGLVVPGAGRGRGLGFPTANLKPQNELLPGKGVYACRGRLEGDVQRDAVVNIGVNPTFGSDGINIEIHLLDFEDRDLYGRRIDIDFVKRLREERRFPGPAELVEQIKSDINQARKSLNR